MPVAYKLQHSTPLGKFQTNDFITIIIRYNNLIIVAIYIYIWFVVIKLLAQVLMIQRRRMCIEYFLPLNAINRVTIINYYNYIIVHLYFA